MNVFKDLRTNFSALALLCTVLATASCTNDRQTSNHEAATAPQETHTGTTPVPNQGAGSDQAAVDAYMRGHDLMSQQKYQESIPCFTEAIRLNPGLSAAYWQRASAYIWLGKYDLAVQDCDSVIKLEPKSNYAYDVRATAHLMLNEPEKAVADSSQAIALDPKNSARAYFTRANAYSVLQQHQRAIDDLNDAIKLEPKYAENSQVYTYLAKSYDALKKYDQAIDCCRTALNLDPKCANAYKIRADAYSHLGNVSSADEDLKKYNQLSKPL